MQTYHNAANMYKPHFSQEILDIMLTFSGIFKHFSPFFNYVYFLSLTYPKATY